MQRFQKVCNITSYGGKFKNSYICWYRNEIRPNINWLKEFLKFEWNRI